MNPNAILQSNLLDIIFENRNKEYGAYVLRKTYHHRLRLALVIAAACTALVCLLIAGWDASMPEASRGKITAYKDPQVIQINMTKKMHSHVALHSAVSKKSSRVAGPPAVVDSVMINKTKATLAETMPSLNGAPVPEGNSSVGFAGGIDSKAGASGEAVVPVRQVDRDAPTDAPDVMPQYPGGVAALLAFLKANLVAPEGVNAGEDVSVRVKFVVNYNGKLQGFDILQSGGRAFDDEVLGLLKKMPLWIPGRSNGENVSVYFVVPVRFTGDN